MMFNSFNAAGILLLMSFAASPAFSTEREIFLACSGEEVTQYTDGRIKRKPENQDYRLDMTRNRIQVDGRWIEAAITDSFITWQDEVKAPFIDIHFLSRISRISGDWRSTTIASAKLPGEKLERAYEASTNGRCRTVERKAF